MKLEDYNSKVLSPPLSYSKYAANARVTIEAFVKMVRASDQDNRFIW